MKRALFLVLAVAAAALLAVPAKAPAFADTQQGDGSLMVAWDFENASDTTVKDLSGNERTGSVLEADFSFTLNSGVPSEGWGAARWFENTATDKAIVFDTGRNSNVFYTAGKYEMLYDDCDFYNGLTDYTFSSWVKFGEVPAPNTNVTLRSAWLYLADRKQPLDSFNGVGFDYGYAGQQMFYSPPADIFGTVHAASYPLTKSEWFNMTVVFKSSKISIYINGERIEIIGAGQTADDAVYEKAAGTMPGKHKKNFDVLTLGGGHQTGAQYGGYFRPANMFLDNACFYDKALTKDEIAKVMNGNFFLAGAAATDDSEDPQTGKPVPVTASCGSITTGGTGLYLSAAGILILFKFASGKKFAASARAKGVA